MIDRVVVSSIVMCVCVCACACVLGCLSTHPPKMQLEPIDPVPAAVFDSITLPSDDFQKVDPQIVMHSGATCPPCKLWIARDMKGWQKLGWNVSIIEEQTSSRPWPWYEITDGDGLCFEVDGPLDKAKYELARKKALGK